ncbi:hypothetical protein DYI24_00805 [Rhodopseudomonas sp. BR0C11]|uniref:hypothetical protein n=1 Tax=Rhodopseudomonas sp. BR0C11 TaxID=2269370 RepID=UPI0013DE9448|nr:hypothetical protein [Rhodopseudomonas sp. BR0C11]NEV75617.1 hypothetical protein [Rhodopseudomonas sp. BR0C11]
MTESQVKTFTAQIYMAGDINQAKMICRKYCYDVGLCVTVEPIDFIYTGGEEAGFRVGLINYPRFPSEPSDILSRAIDLARTLRDELSQHSFSVVTPTETIWDTRRDSTR